jgi:hypothetical protein
MVHISSWFMLALITGWKHNNMKNHTEALLVAGGESGLEVNAKKVHVCSCLVNRMQDKLTT